METQLVKKEMSRRIFSEIVNEPDAYLLMQQVNAFLNEERERRIKFYNDITEQEKVEFINGEIIVHSPVKLKHNRATSFLARLLGIYAGKHDLGFVGIEKIMITLSRNDYEPDICFFRKEKADQLTDNQTLFPAPDLIIEVLSDSTEKRDRGVKFKDYQSHEIPEYWIIDSDKQIVEQYYLIEGKYQLIYTTGTLKSFVVEGFEIPVAAIFNENENLKVLQGF